MDTFNLDTIDNLINIKYNSINSLIITQGNCTLYENYFNGYTNNDARHVASITKSITSLLIGIAIDKGFINSVDDKVLDYLTEYKTNVNMIQESISIKQLLTMTAPFAFSLKSVTARPFEPLDRLRRQKDWVKFIISLMGKGSTIGLFQYSTPSTHLLSAILTKQSGMSTLEFANKYLFSNIGINQMSPIKMKSNKLEDLFGETLPGWVKDPQGINTGGWGISLTPKDMVKIGMLFLNKGVYENHRVVSESWVKESTIEQTNGYGYLWWIKEVNGHSTYAALGYGGHIICCIPALETVIVSTGKMKSNQIDPWELIESIVNEL